MATSNMAAILAAARAKRKLAEDSAGPPAELAPTPLATTQAAPSSLEALKADYIKRFNEAGAGETVFIGNHTKPTAGIDFAAKLREQRAKREQATNETNNNNSSIHNSGLPSSSDRGADSLVRRAHAAKPAYSSASANPAITALRAKLALAAKSESERATEEGRKNGTLPVDEEVVCSVELVPTGTTGTAAGTTSLGMHGELITYNKEQQEFIDLASKGEPCILIGAAGTGKTTCSKGAMSALIASNLIPVLDPQGHRHLLDCGGTPGILIISYTRRAVNNIRKVQSEDLKRNCITSHKLLEYAPERFEIQDEETGETKRTMRFLPNRNSSNPLPSSISTIVVEEASMLSVELYKEITDAILHTVQWIFIGDIQQLPPVFGSAILGYKMLELPVIELTQVYRQALESPIIRLAHRILSGKPIPAEEYPSWNFEGKLTIKPWKKKLSAEHAALTLAAFFKAAEDGGVYDPNEDMILIPYNKACGTLEVNNNIANHLARKRGVKTYEIRAGFNKIYLSEGDKVLYDREDAEVVAIEFNPAYSGVGVQPPSKTLDYWGHNPNVVEDSGFDSCGADSEEDVDFLLEQVASSEDRVTLASHTIVVRLSDSASEVTLTKSAEVNSLLHSYALTVHKSQGSEWRKVFLCLHQSHATMLQRELLYTGVTRAREELYVICEPESFTRGIVAQKIKGNTLAEKAEHFKGKQERLN